MEIKGPPSSNETIKGGEEMNDLAMKAVDGRILPTCDEHYSKSLKSQEGEELKYWDALPIDVQVSVLRRLKYEDYFQFKRVSRSARDLIDDSNPFLSSQEDSVSQEGSLTSLYVHIKHGEVQWSGFDLLLKTWRPLPPLRCFPFPFRTLIKHCLLCAGNGLLCLFSAEAFEIGRMIVYNPLTQFGRFLLPLNFPRNPVLMHMVANATSYKIIVVGSSGMLGGEILSRKTEVYDSRTSQWEVTGDMPGVDFSLNEYQTGIVINRILYCIAFLEDGSGKGVVAYDMEEGKWLVDWKCPLPALGNANSCSVQLVECDGGVYLFQERETGWTVEHRIDKLENVTRGGGSGKWKNIVREKQTAGGRGLSFHREFVCVSFGVGKLCIFNTLRLTGKVYDIRNGGYLGPLPSNRKGHKAFHLSLNPLSFTFEPSFKSAI